MDFNKLTLKAQEAVAAAMDLARRQGNPEVYPEHLILALLDQELPQTLVERAGGSVADLRAKAEAALAAKPAVRGTATQQPRASAAFSRVLEIDPADAGAMVNLGQIHTQERRERDAIPLFRAAVAIEPANATAIYSLGQALIRTGEAGEGARVLKDFERVRESGAAVTYSQTYLEQGRYAEAITATGLEADLVDAATPEVRFSDQTQLWGGTSAAVGAVTLADLDRDIGKRAAARFAISRGHEHISIAQLAEQQRGQIDVDCKRRRAILRRMLIVEVQRGLQRRKGVGVIGRAASCDQKTVGPERAVERVREVLHEARQRGEVKINDCAVAARQFVALLRSDLHLRVTLGLRPPPTREELQAHVMSVVAVFLHGAWPTGLRAIGASRSTSQ